MENILSTAIWWVTFFQAMAILALGLVTVAQARLNTIMLKRLDDIERTLKRQGLTR